jgi:predicted amidohydrolase YtcJ
MRARRTASAVRSGDSRRRWLKLAASLAATAPLPLRGQPGRDPGRPLVVVNARVHAAHPAGNGATALAVEAGRISMLGSDAALLGLRPAGARVIDAGGRWLVPGLCDLEADLLSAGLAYTRTLRWDGAGSLPVALARLREHAAGLPAGAWVVVEGASPRVDAWLSGLDDGAIDIAAGGRPVLVVTAPGQGRINPPAARRLGLDPGAGLALSGMAAQAAHAHALGAARDSAERDASVERLGRQYARFGVTTLVDIGEAAYPDDYASLVRLNAAGRLPVRVACFLATNDARREAADLAQWSSVPFAGQGDRWLQLLGARIRATEAGAIDSALLALARARWAWRIEAADAQALDGVLLAVDRLRERQSIDRLRWVVDIAREPDTTAMNALRRLGGGVCLSPVRLPGDAAPGLVDRLVEHGVPIGLGGGGSRRAGLDPWRMVDWLAPTLQGGDADRLREARLAALARVAAGNAWALDAEGVAGALAPGRPADFAILDHDPFVASPARQASRLTVAGGRVTWADGPFAEFAPASLARLPPGSSVDRLPPYPGRTR